MQVIIVPTPCSGWPPAPPRSALVLGAHGRQKAKAVAAMVEGPLSSLCAGSALQLHAAATVILDEAAASELTLTDHCRYTYDHLAQWQRFDLG